MKKVNKENPLTHFRKANEARQKIVTASMKKMQEGGGPSEPGPGQVYENIKKKYAKKYYTLDNIYTGKTGRQKQADALIEKQATNEMKYRKKKGIANTWK
jgi:hypothetical protein